MNVIQLEANINTTEDCKKLLNKYIATKNWKRLYKTGDAIRCFSNEDNEMVTIAPGILVHDSEINDATVEICAFVGINIHDEINAIRKIAKLYYTCDYGEIFYNPYTKIIHIVEGDGGTIYALRKPKDEDEFYELVDDDTTFKEFNTHTETSFITSVVWADEYYPNEEGYMFIGRINEFNG